MHYHIILTELCNSECRYCYKKSLEEFDNKLGEKFEFDFSSPEKSQVNVKKLKEFLKKDKNLPCNLPIFGKRNTGRTRGNLFLKHIVCVLN